MQGASRAAQAQGEGSRRHPHAAAALSPPAQVLQRCGWRVVLRDDGELRQALADLQSCPLFHALVSHTLECAHAHGSSWAAAGPRPAAAKASLDGSYWQHQAAPRRGAVSQAVHTRQQQQQTQGILQTRNRR